LSVVQREADGDAFFPAFEGDFEWADTALVQPEFRVEHYLRRGERL
jgi:hypothetical protein